MEWDNHKNPKNSFTIVTLQWAILEFDLPCILICFAPLKLPAKGELALFQTSSVLFQLFLFLKCWRFFQDLNSKGMYLNSPPKKKIVVL